MRVIFFSSVSGGLKVLDLVTEIQVNSRWANGRKEPDVSVSLKKAHEDACAVTVHVSWDVETAYRFVAHQSGYDELPVDLRALSGDVNKVKEHLP